MTAKERSKGGKVAVAQWLNEGFVVGSGHGGFREQLQADE
jgi:hypothetical protein